jgi:opacity protein-like surface antigen
VIPGQLLGPSRGIVTGAVLFLSLFTATAALAQDEGLTFAGSKLVAPFGCGAFPTGRFGKTDVEADPPKSGNNAGLGAGIDIGFFVSEYLAVGAGLGYVRFPLDFGAELETQFPTKTANTSVLLGEIWARALMPNGFNRWRPYAVVGLGVGRPKGKIDYKEPFIIPLPDDGGTIEIQSAESTVNTTVAITGGIGSLIPISRSVALAIEPRYTSISTKGSGRTDRYTDTSGETVELDDTAKSNTNWWEIRAGLVLTVR